MEVKMHSSLFRALLAGSALLAGFVLEFPTGMASAGGPMIQVQEESAPYVTGSGFTPNGPVVLKEKQVGVKGAIAKLHITAESNGDIAQFGECDGNNAISFVATDTTTGLKSNKTASGVYTCIN
jgi:hypothetical protein